VRKGLHLCLVLVSLGFPPTALGRNKVANPGFELLRDQDGTLEDWGLPSKPGVSFSVDDQIYRTGSMAGRIEGLDQEKQSRYVQAWRQNVEVRAGERLWLSLWLKGESVTRARVNLLHMDNETQVLLNQLIGEKEGTFGWTEVAEAIEIHPEAVSLQLVIGLVKSTGVLWVDDVSLDEMQDLRDAFGSLDVDPASPQEAGASVPTRFTMTLGQCGLVRGGSVCLRWDYWRAAREFKLTNMEADCAREGAVFEVTVPPRKTSWPPTPKPVACMATLTEGGPLGRGDQVVVRASLTYTMHSNVPCTMEALVVPAKDSARRPMACPHLFRAHGGKAAELRCIAEARPLVDAPCRVTVAVVDAHGNPVESFRGEVRLDCDRPCRLPEGFAFTKGDGGSRTLEACFPGSEVYRVRASCGELSATSNPIQPRAPEEPAVYFGDIHSHCEISADAVGDPDEAYDYARRFWGLDFAGLSDHSPKGDKWERAIRTCNRNNAPPRFVALLGFEWSDPVNGHRNAYYRGGEGPEQPTGLPSNMEPWWQFFTDRKVRALTVPHHPNTESRAKRPDGKPVWGPMDWSVINHEFQRVVEICQLRGSFEVPGGPVPEFRVAREDRGSSVQTALALGHRLGFIGSTDTHSGRPGTGPARCAVFSHELTRAGVWDALYDRRCYATTGAHILLSFRLNGRSMGRELVVADPSQSRAMQWSVSGTAPIQRIDLLRNNEVVRRWDGQGRLDVSGEWSYDRPLEDTEWWYLRVLQEDTEIAWSSPIWVNVRTE